MPLDPKLKPDALRVILIETRLHAQEAHRQGGRRAIPASIIRR
jgi:hypothetical protein